MWETICDAWACWSGWKFGPNSTEYPYSPRQFQNTPPPQNWNLARSWDFWVFSVTEYPPPPPGLPNGKLCVVSYHMWRLYPTWITTRFVNCWFTNEGKPHPENSWNRGESFAIRIYSIHQIHFIMQSRSIMYWAPPKGSEIATTNVTFITLSFFYLPQRSWGKVIFSEACVPLWADTPPPRSSACWEIWATSGQYASYWNAYLLPPANEVWGKVIFLHLFVILFTGGVCLSACWDTTTPRTMHPPQHRACWGIWATSGWYASYWNAYLLFAVCR